MASIKSFPNNQDVYIGAEDAMKWLHGRTSGVFGAGGNALVSALQTPGMAITVSDGNGWMSNSKGDGIVWWNDTESANMGKLQLPISAADSVLNRIDRVIVEWKTTNYVDYPEIKILKGAIKSNPVPPRLTNTDTIRQISLARISVPAGTIKITSSMITDERMDKTVCGIVTDFVEVDTSGMQDQFEALLARIQSELEHINAGTAAVLKTGDTMAGSLNMAGHSLTGLPAPMASTDAVRKDYVDTETKTYADAGITGAKAYAAGLRVQNLLDNSDFNNPVNQRGFTSSSAPWAMLIDRWEKSDAGSVQIDSYGNENALTINGSYIFQRVGTAFKAGVTYTFAVNFYVNTDSISLYTFFSDQGSSPAVATFDKSGTLVLDFTADRDIDPDTGNTFLRIEASNTVAVRWAALYEGSYTAETLPPYVPKGYGAELAECQRYFIKPLTQAIGFASSETTAFFPVSLPVTMRKNPTVTGSVQWLRTEGKHMAQPDASLSGSVGANGVTITMTGGTGLTTHKAVYAAFSNFSLSADL